MQYMVGSTVPNLTYMEGCITVILYQCRASKMLEEDRSDHTVDQFPHQWDIHNSRCMDKKLPSIIHFICSKKYFGEVISEEL